MSVDAIADEILAAAIGIGGETWQKVKKSAPIFVKAYAQSLVDIAAGVAQGPVTGISKADGKIFADNAKLLLVMGIANTNQILFAQVQKFINQVISIAKSAVNARLPIAIL